MAATTDRDPAADVFALDPALVATAREWLRRDDHAAHQLRFSCYPDGCGQCAEHGRAAECITSDVRAGEPFYAECSCGNWRGGWHDDQQLHDEFTGHHAAITTADQLTVAQVVDIVGARFPYGMGAFARVHAEAVAAVRTVLLAAPEAQATRNARDAAATAGMLAVALVADDRLEELGMEADDRRTCWTCQSWADHAHRLFSDERISLAEYESERGQETR